MMRPRLALVGFSSPLGRALLLAIEESEWEPASLDLWDPAPAGGLTQFRGEAKLVQPLPEDPAAVLADADMLLLCGDPEFLSPAQQWCAASGCPAVSLAPPGPDAPTGPIVYVGTDPEPTTVARGSLLYAPGPAGAAAGRILSTLNLEENLARATVLSLVPAGDHSRRGPEALLNQTLAVVNMEPPPMEMLGHLRAFNLVPGEPSPWFRTELESVLRLAPGDAFTAHLEAPVFHGYGLSLDLTLKRPMDPEAIRGLLDLSDLKPTAGPEASLHEAVDTGTLRLSLLAADKTHLWFWAAFDIESSSCLDNALDLATRQFQGGTE